MSEQSRIRFDRSGHKHRLLATASIAALIIGASAPANAEDADRPVVWLEAGWHYQAVKESDEPFMPDFTSLLPASGLSGSPSAPQQALAYSYGAEGKILFQPEDSDWIFSAAVTYGRAHGHNKIHQETAPPSISQISSIPATGFYYKERVPVRAGKTLNFTGSNAESHAIADFQVGKDVGLGILGGKSELTAGIRFAQFKAQSSPGLFLDPDFHVTEFHESFQEYRGGHYVPAYVILPVQIWHNYSGSAHISRSFQGIGPSISWDASSPIAGNASDGAINIDWGVNAALLFGRQKTRAQHKTSSELFDFSHVYGTQVYNNAPPPVDRSRSVTVPNLGGFAGLSLQWANAKLSVGYRGDFFFGAIDGGIDTRHDTTRGFYGPFASIRVGVSPSDF